jgi:hypothetical protein
MNCTAETWQSTVDRRQKACRQTCFHKQWCVVLVTVACVLNGRCAIVVGQLVTQFVLIISKRSFRKTNVRTVSFKSMV